MRLLLVSLLAACALAIEEDPEYGEYYQGDMMFPDGLFEDYKQGPFNAIIGNQYRWPGSPASVPYSIDDFFSGSQISQIQAGVSDLNTLTRVGGQACIDIHEADGSENNYISVYSGGGCSSYIGRIGGAQGLSLADGCFRHGTIMHEFLHALGFYHEQSRGDRDDHVIINWDNIRPGTERNFEAEIEGITIDHLGTPYDFDSCMHYGAYGFAVDPTIPTIFTINPDNQDRIGQRTRLSTQDIRRVQNLYCPNLVDPVAKKIDDWCYFTKLHRVLSTGK